MVCRPPSHGGGHALPRRHAGGGRRWQAAGCRPLVAPWWGHRGLIWLASLSFLSLSDWTLHASLLIDLGVTGKERGGPKGECCRALPALSFLARRGRPMDCGMVFASALRLLARDTLDVAPLLLPLLVFTLVASPFVALVLKAVLKKIMDLCVRMDFAQSQPGAPWRSPKCQEKPQTRSYGCCRAQCFRIRRVLAHHDCLHGASNGSQVQLLQGQPSACP